MFDIALLISVLAPSVLSVSPSYNGLGKTPQMGWNNWNSFACDVSEDLLLGTSEKIVKWGLKDLGYKYVVLDDCWSSGRNSSGYLVPDSKKFPRGMKHVGDSLHDEGLLFGMYSSAGEYTCAGYSGSLGHEEADAAAFASWGVDYLKYDNCYNQGNYGTAQLSYERYKAMSDALNKTGKNIYYTLCNWGEDSPWHWASAIANSWRISGDVYAHFDRPDSRCPCDGDEYYCHLAGFDCSIMNILNKAAPLGQKAGPGGWNDLDSLEVGVGNMTDEEEKTHFSMWAAVKSPLVIGANLNSLDAKSFSIYVNPAIIAVNQDPAGVPATRVWRYYVSDTDEYGQGEIQLWSGPLDNGDQIVALVNAGSNPRPMNATLADVFFDSGADSKKLSSSWGIYDLWANRLSEEAAESIISGNSTASGKLYNATDLSYGEGIAKNDTRLFGTKVGRVEAFGAIETVVPPHGVAFYRLRQE